MISINLPNGLTKLIAEDGYLIVYMGDYSTATTVVYLGVKDSAENYSEVTVEAIEEWQAEQEEKRKREIDAHDIPPSVTD